MGQSTCAIDRCPQNTKARGWCGKHYHRWLRHGDPQAGRAYDNMPFAEKLEVYTERSGDCILWTGGLNNKGYGVTGNLGRSAYVHRLSYEHFVGPIPEGMEIDHLCRVPRCLNPDHLEAVTHSTNVARGLSPIQLRERHSSRTECSEGHPYDEANTYHPPATPDVRVCRECKRQRWREWDARRRAGQVGHVRRNSRRG